MSLLLAVAHAADSGAAAEASPVPLLFFCSLAVPLFFALVFALSHLGRRRIAPDELEPPHGDDDGVTGDDAPDRPDGDAPSAPDDDGGAPRA